jgi:hypothetical protein
MAPSTSSEPRHNEGNAVHQESLEQSLVFVGEMRKAIRIDLSGDVDRIKERIDKLSDEVDKASVNVERIQDELLEEPVESE